MKRIILILLAILIALTAWDIARSMRRARDKLWVISAVKAPGRMALEDIEADLYAGRTDLAKAKLAAFRKEWAAFDSGYEFHGPGIGKIIATFHGLEQAAAVSGPSGGTNGITTVEYAGRFNTFRVGEKSGIPLSYLRAALLEHHRRNPGAVYEVVGDEKISPEEEKMIAAPFRDAGITLAHCWSPQNSIPLGPPAGRHGSGYVDVLSTPSNRSSPKAKSGADASPTAELDVLQARAALVDYLTHNPDKDLYSHPPSSLLVVKPQQVSRHAFVVGPFSINTQKKTWSATVVKYDRESESERHEWSGVFRRTPQGAWVADLMSFGMRQSGTTSVE